MAQIYRWGQSVAGFLAKLPHPTPVLGKEVVVASSTCIQAVSSTFLVPGLISLPGGRAAKASEGVEGEGGEEGAGEQDCLVLLLLVLPHKDKVMGALVSHMLRLWGKGEGKDCCLFCSPILDVFCTEGPWEFRGTEGQRRPDALTTMQCGDEENAVLVL